MNDLRRYILLAALCLTPALATGQLVLRAPDGSDVQIFRDDFGVPHVIAQTDEALFFAQGFVVGTDRFVQLEQGRRIGEGRASEIPLLSGLLAESDRMVLRDFYTPDERREQFERLDDEFKAMFASYTAGVNRFLDSMAANPDRYRPPEVDLLNLLGFEIEPWTVTNSIAITQFLLRQFGQFGGQELDRLAELQENGEVWFEEHRPINDPDVPTTIPPGESNVVEGREGRGQPFRPLWPAGLPRINPDVIRSINDRESFVLKVRGEHGIPNSFGSFAVLIAPSRSEDGVSMLLGAPQMLVPDSATTSILYEIELQSPSIHLAGASAAGIPGILIGRSDRHAWTLTSGVSDNTDVFIETTEDTTFGRYLHEGEWLEFEVFHDTLQTGAQPVPFTHYRTLHGPVFGEDLSNRQVFSRQMTFWDRELEALQAFTRMWRAGDWREFELGVSAIPMSFNVFYADVDGNLGYWHAGRYRSLADTLDPRLPRLGDASQEWPGLMPFDGQPQVVNPAQSYLVNWNNKPAPSWNNGDNIAWALANALDTQRRADRVSTIDDIVSRNLVVSFADLTTIPFEMTEICRSETSADLDCYTRGTYEQMLALGVSEQTAVNVLPPGQTASPLLAALGPAGPHANDQWPLYTEFEYKPMLFGAYAPVSSRSSEVPSERLLLQGIYPNPLNSTATIRFELPDADLVTIAITDILGQKLTTISRRWTVAGRHEVDFNMTDRSSGVYFLRIDTSQESVVSSLVVVR